MSTETLVQAPPRGMWGQSSQVTLVRADCWLGRPLDPKPSIDAYVRRYLAAFGPATVADVSTWSRLTGVRAVLDRLRPELAVFADERGRELFDLPDAPRPAPTTKAPVRFLPEYDNLLLAHADRSRFHHPPDAAGIGRLWEVGRHGIGTVLYDGVVRASWRLEHGGTPGAHLSVRHLPTRPTRSRSAIESEAVRLLRFLTSDALTSDAATSDVRFESRT